MAEAAISHLLSISKLIVQEFQMLSGLREEIEQIRYEFERMTAFLGVVDANEKKHQELIVYVRQVREASYEAGDVLEQFMLQFNQNPGDGTCGFFLKVFHLIATFAIRRKIATNIQKIKSTLGDIFLGYQRYHDMLSRIEHGTGSHNSWYDGRGDALLIGERDVVGIKRPKLELMKWLTSEDSRLRVFSVVGMGGLGKTTLVKKVFDDVDMRRNFQIHVWVTVSETYKIDELLKDIIKQLYGEVNEKVPKGMEKMDSNYLKKTINNFLIQKRYLLVLDDVWHIHAWQALKYAFPDGNHGSRVILTTRIASIAASACKEYNGEVHNLVPLPGDKSWTLFCKKAFQGQSCPQHLEGLSRAILRKCEGLPLAIVAIGGLLSTKDQGNLDEWDRVYRTLGTELALLDMQKVLLLSYIELPYHLKVCFLYLSIFPENYLIDHWRLVRMLVAEGFVEPRQGMTIEVAATYLTELESRSLILVEKLSVTGTVKSYRIHDMWRETIVPKSMDQGLVTVSSARERRWPERVRRLSIHDGFQNWQEIKHCAQKLRSLLIFGSIDEVSAFHILASLKDARLLKVLDMRGFPLTTFPEGATKLLHLTYLSLRGTKIKIIPNSIGNLQMLETLDLKDTLVTQLPDEITTLRRLRHLLVYCYIHDPFYLPFHDHFGFRAPVGIRNLSCLQKLCSIELPDGPDHVNILREIGELTQLRRVNFLHVTNENGIGLCSSINKLENLRSVFIGALNEDEIIDLESIHSPPQFLRTLSIKGRLRNLPSWIPSLQNVSRLHLRYTKLKACPLNQLQDLPNLIELYLERTYEGEVLIFQAGGFQRLKNLWLDSLGKMRQVVITEGAMPQLKRLHIIGCELLDDLPSGIELLTGLKDLRLINMSDTLVSKFDRDVPNGDYQRIAHIPSKFVAGFIDGRWRRHHI